MKIHKNSRLTPHQRVHLKQLYASGEHTQLSLAARFGVTRATVVKWLNREVEADRSSAPHHRRSSISTAFEQAVCSYRQDPVTAHHGVIRIAQALQSVHSCSNPSNVYQVLKRCGLNKRAPAKVKVEKKPIKVGKHRTQMDVQQLPAIKGSSGFEYKISIIHLSTRIKYSEIHDNCRAQTIAQVYENALDRLPPFS